MLRRLGILALAALALTGCGGSTSGTTTVAAPPETTTGAESEAVAVRTFFLHDGALVPKTVSVPATQAVARAALEQLLAGPPAGYETAIPRGAQLEDVAIQDGVATASFSSALGAPTRTAQGQIVSTLTQFPTVRAAKIVVDGKPVALQDGSGTDLTRPATGVDYADLTSDALIFVRTPARDSTVTSPVELAGTASVFEATLVVEVWSGGQKATTKTITASQGAPERGTWSTRLALPEGDVRLLLYEPSAEDGSPLHETEVLLHVK
jgi:hypothetical protein